MPSQTKYMRSLFLAVSILLTVPSEIVLAGGSESDNVNSRLKQSYSESTREADSDALHRSKKTGSRTNIDSLDQADLQKHSPQRAAELVKKAQKANELGTGSSGGGDHWVTDFVDVARKRLYPWLVANQASLAAQQIYIDPQEFYDHIDPQTMRSLPQVFESCDYATKGIPREGCFNDNAKDEGDPTLYHFTLLSQSMYEIEDTLSCRKVGFVLHEMLRRMGKNLDQHQDSSIMPLNCHIDQLSLETDPKTVIEIPAGTMIALKKSIVIPAHTGFDLSAQFNLGMDANNQWIKSCWVNLEKAAPIGGVLKKRNLIVKQKRQLMFHPYNQVVFLVSDQTADENAKAASESATQSSDFNPRVREVVCDVTTNPSAHFVAEPLTETTYGEIKETLKNSGFSIILDPLPEK